MEKRLKNDFDQRTACGAPVRWLKYTTAVHYLTQSMNICFRNLPCSLSVIVVLTVASLASGSPQYGQLRPEGNLGNEVKV